MAAIHNCRLSGANKFLYRLKPVLPKTIPTTEELSGHPAQLAQVINAKSLEGLLAKPRSARTGPARSLLIGKILDWGTEYIVIGAYIPGDSAEFEALVVGEL